MKYYTFKYFGNHYVKVTDTKIIRIIVTSNGDVVANNVSQNMFNRSFVFRPEFKESTEEEYLTAVEKLKEMLDL